MLQVDAVFFDIGDTLVDTPKRWAPEAKSLLAKIATEARLGLISNTGDLTRSELADQHLPDDFDFGFFTGELIFLSSEVGIEKPDIRIFSKAIANAAVPPWRCVFVGENLQETLAAQQAGMRAVRIAQARKDFPQLLHLLFPTG